MKKFLAVVMTAVLAMSMMTACGSSKSSEENKDTTAAKAETTKAETIDASGVTLVSDGVLTDVYKRQPLVIQLYFHIAELNIKG